MNTPDVTCLITKTTKHYLAKGKKIEVIARYLRMRYKISIDLNVLRKRVSGDMMAVGIS